MHDTPPTKPSVELLTIGREHDPLLRNLFELYLHDMAEWFQFDIGADGRYDYDTQAAVWDMGYDVRLVKVGPALAGFAITGKAPPGYPDPEISDVHEFFVIRRFRRTGIGQSVATELWNRTPGEWLVRVFEPNLPAVPFWRATIATYTAGEYTETRELRNDRPWRYFRFRAGAS
jgi:predicted acetyltransferase